MLNVMAATISAAKIAVMTMLQCVIELPITLLQTLTAFSPGVHIFEDTVDSPGAVVIVIGELAADISVVPTSG